MDYLDNDKIVNIFKDYLENNLYNYAIMLNGDWGSGKTYFVKEILFNKLEKQKIKKKPIYISLYGLKNIDEITNSIFTKVVESRIGKGQKFLPFIKGGVEIATDLINKEIGVHIFDKKKAKKILSPFVKYDDYFFVFDDLERSSMLVNEVLGYINNFVEQNKAKVLIIANEKEIGTVETQDSKLLKCLIAANDLIDWPQKEKDSFEKVFYSGADYYNQQKKVDLDEIKFRSNLLSNENDFYLQVKEKLIGQTIYYRPNLQQIVPDIFKKCIKSKSNTFEDNCIEKICEIMQSEDHFNIRTLQYSLVLFSMICNDFTNRGYKLPYYEETLLQVLEANLKVSIAYKKGKSENDWSENDWSENSEYGKIYIKNKFIYCDYFTSFKFIHDYVCDGIYDSKRIQNVLSSYIEELKIKKENLSDPTNVLEYFWKMEDVEITENIKKLYKNLQLGKYKGESYRWILSLLYKIKGCGLEPVEITNFIEIIKKNVKEGASIQTMQRPIIEKENSCFSEYISCLEELRNIESRVKQNIKTTSINNIFKNESGWGNELINYRRENEQAILSEHGFFKYIDIDKLKVAIENASVKDLSDFYKVINSIYNLSNLRDYYSEDADNINCFIDLLKNIKTDSKMKQYNIKIIQEKLKYILDKLTDNNEN